MRWPEIFFKSRKPGPVPVREPEKKTTSPIVPESKKPVEPTPAQLAADKTAAESLRALKQKDTMQLAPPETPKRFAGKETTLLPLAPDNVVSPPPTETPSDVPAAPTSSTRRRAKLTDFARVLPPKSVENGEMPAPETPVASDDPASAVVPAAFPVTGTAGHRMETPEEKEAQSTFSSDGLKNLSSKSRAAEEKPDASPSIRETPGKPDLEVIRPAEAATSSRETSPEVSLKDTTRVSLPERAVAPPQDRPPPAALELTKAPLDSRQKKEFILANGERILGHVLSETTDTIYLEHQTLGVLTLPRLQIAAKPIEVILINGDRIVGDLIAETTECLYIRHASLGMLTVPHSQRSTRVVEAILKDGDRILGEVLAETDDFTVIRSATLGTVAVQHEQVAMLNRKIEQTQLRALPTPALENAKPDPASSS